MSLISIEKFITDALFDGKIVFNSALGRTLDFGTDGSCTIGRFDREANKAHYLAHPGESIEGDCEMVSSAIAGVLVGSGFADKAYCVFSERMMHFGCVAVRDDENFFIDCGRTRPIPVVLKIDGSTRESTIYGSPFCYSADFSPEVGFIVCTSMQVSKPESIDQRVYKPFPDPVSLGVLRAAYSRVLTPIRVSLINGNHVIEDLSETELGRKRIEVMRAMRDPKIQVVFAANTAPSPKVHGM